LLTQNQQVKYNIIKKNLVKVILSCCIFILAPVFNDLSQFGLA
jgi:hypothetical protein